MASLETAELKLKSTPTGGAEAHQSPYYRRLVSAGYKGFLQGTMGGASLYGIFGLIVGGLAAIPLAAAVGPTAFLLAPAFAGIGIFKGADTFGQIGSMAAITAESSDLSEQRRYLLDRYYDLPDGPEGDREAEAIKRELLSRAVDQGSPPNIFHWKTVFVGAAIGTALALGVLLVTGGLTGSAVAIATKALTYLGISQSFASLSSLGALTLGAAGAITGALTGATIGIDRYYIRKWFDHTQNIVHPSSHQDYGLMERHKQFERIKEAAKQDEKTKQQMATMDKSAGDVAKVSAPTTLSDTIVEKQAEKPVEKPAEKPAHTISAARREGLLEIQKAMELAGS